MNKDYGHYPLPKILNDVKRDLRKHILNKLKIYKIIDDFKKKIDQRFGKYNAINCKY